MGRITRAIGTKSLELGAEFALKNRELDLTTDFTWLPKMVVNYTENSAGRRRELDVETRVSRGL